MHDFYTSALTRPPKADTLSQLDNNIEEGRGRLINTLKVVVFNV
jgi:hypothetical protein